MEVLVERCCGIDLGKATLKACIREPNGKGGRRQEVRSYTTTTRSLLELRDWLTAHGVTVVGMESTGVYWKPLYYLLEGSFRVDLLNARHMRNVPGRKTDVQDSQWIAQLVEHGLLRASFVPPPDIRRLRDLTRLRAALIDDRSRDKQRVESVLEDAGIKLGIVATDIFGVSGRAMMAALIRGERDPFVLAQMAKAGMRRKLAALAEALVGRFADHHAFLLRTLLDRIDATNTTIASLDERIEVEMEPFRDAIARLDTIPGVNKTPPGSSSPRPAPT